MSQPQQMNMANMGGPVGGGSGVAPQMNAGTPGNSGGFNMTSDAMSTKVLNTAIYDYFLRNSHYKLAEQLYSEVEIEIKPDTKQSPNQRNGQQANGIDDSADVDSKDNAALLGRPTGLPMARNPAEGPFLQDWWSTFWDVYSNRKNRSNTANTQSYLAAQRNRMQPGQRMGMVPAGMDAQRNYSMMLNNNGMMPNDLKRVAMQNQRGTPQQMAQANKMQNAQQNAQGNEMQRSGSQMDVNGPRSGSPGSGDAPSPKRQRIEGGNMQQMNQGRPGQPGQMQGNQVGHPNDISSPDPLSLEQTQELLRKRGLDPDKISRAQLYNLATQPTNVQAQSVEVYSQSIQQSMQAAMNSVNKPNSNVNKGMPPNMGPGGAQGSPMSQAGMDGATGEFYAANGGRGMPMQQSAAAVAAAGGQAAGNSNGNHALQDYQMQLMLLEQQNKKRLLMARQEQDNMAHPGGVGPNGQFAPGMSPPPGSGRAGDPSPNANDMQARGSPTPGGMIDPAQMPPQMRQQMLMNQQNGGQMRPPSSHPNFTQEQLQQMRQNGMQVPNGQFPGGQPPQSQMMPGQVGPGAQPGQPMGTPRQQNTNMPPPPAPQTNAGGTQPSSPSQQAAPPTPSTATKAKPGGKKEPANKKGAAKKGGNTGATPASESEHPPTPTPATPITPHNPNSFNKQNANLPNGAGAAAAANAQANAANAQAQQANANAVQQPPPNPANDLPFGNLDGSDGFNMNMDFGPLDGGDVLDSFDFDSFLNNDGDMLGGWDASNAFDGTAIEGLGE